MSGRHLFFFNRALIVKAIEELQFEELLKLQKINEKMWKLEAGNNIEYRFKGKIGAWNNIQVQEDSLQKLKDGLEQAVYTASSFFYEVQEVCGIDDATLGQFLEEMHQTLYCDEIRFNRLKTYTASELSKLSFHEIDQLLPGHPKLLLNKGRLGWGVGELSAYTPESGQSFQLIWIAIKKEKLSTGIDPNISYENLLLSSLNKRQIESARVSLEEHGLNPDSYYVIPVHPWQWDRYIRIQYQDYIFKKDMVYIGVLGDFYTPQASIRTLTNINNPMAFDIKVSTSILNTSCIRGLPGKYVGVGYEISKFVDETLSKDEFFKEHNTRVLKETAAFSAVLESHKNVEGCSYRYKELLGCVWRESVASVLRRGEQAVPTGALIMNHNGEHLIKFYVLDSGLSPKEWLKHYFDKVVLPLYHLQVKHGIGLVAHGQNTILILEDSRPSGLIIKDFHGDLRVSESVKFNGEFAAFLERLPKQYLIHDLFTGHFVTVLRYLSRVMEESLSLPEKDFYAVLGEVIDRYLRSTEVKIDISVDLRKSEFEKILVNKVRFVSGYSETSQRLRPILGNNIKNPIARNMEESKL